LKGEKLMVTLYQKDKLRLLVGHVDQDVRFTEKDGERLLSVPGKKSVLCAIRCSGVRETEKNGKIYLDLTGYRIECMTDKAEADTAAAAA
jgi:hypothetical protein